MSEFMKPFDPPPTNLGRYRLLSPTAGVHVSPLVLGAGNIGDKWADLGYGSMNKESSFKLLDAQDETSEMFIGEWAEQRGIRDQLFIASKYTMNYKRGNKDYKQQVMFMGNSTKSLHISLEASLKKLRTTYIDLFYVHMWDFDTSIEEVMRALHNVVAQGKVLYLGISDTPAWVVSRANTFARAYGLTPFVIYQGAWNVMERSFEREIIPMARAEGMALAPWYVLGAGKFRTDEEEERRRQTGEKGRTIFDANWERTEKEKVVSRGRVPVFVQVAIAYVMHKTPYVFPILGGRKVEQLHANLDSLVEFDPGFPHTIIGDGSKPMPYFSMAATIEDRPMPVPVPPFRGGVQH